MKKILFILGLIYFVTSHANELSPQQQIQGTLDKSVACWNNGNLKCFMDVLYVKNQKTLFISGTSFIYGWQNCYQHYINKYGSNKQKIGQLQISIKKIELLDNDYAVAYGLYHLVTTTKTYNGVTPLIFVKNNSKWKVILDHSNS